MQGTVSVTAQAALGIVAGVALAIGCAADKNPPACTADSDCAPGLGCASQACVPKLMSMTGPWAIEVVPPDKGSWAPTEDPAVVFAPEPITLQVQDRVPLAGAIDGAPADFELSAEGTLRVIASVPSRIAGKRDRQFEAMAAVRGMRGPVAFTLPIPMNLVGSEAKVWLIPAAPLDRMLPEWHTTVVLGAAMKLPMLRMADTHDVYGTLLNDFDLPQSAYAVRALVGDRVVSSVATTDEDGRFKVRIPKTGSNRVDLSTVVVELVPTDPRSPRPRLVVRGLNEGRLNLGVLRLPPTPRPEMFEVPVEGAGDPGTEVAGATVRFRTVLPAGANLDAVYLREAQTQMQGRARIELLPGGAGQTREYAVSVIPPANSRFAARCVGMYSIGSSAPGTPRVSATIVLPLKPVLSGRVFGPDGLPAANVQMEATRQADLEARERDACGGDVASPPATATTGADGTFGLLLEPGMYRLEYTPPASAGSPQHVEARIMISADMTRDVNLPPGVLVDGLVRTAGDTPAANCEVRAYATGAGGAVLRARAVSGADGKFRLMLPK